MRKWIEQTDECFLKAGLLDPQTKMAKLRAALPTIEIALANGSTYEQCVEHLKLSGLEITSSYFKNALFRARKKGALLSYVPSKRTASDKGLSAANRVKIEEPKENRVTSVSGSTIVTKKVNEVVISMVEKKDQLTNPNPRLEDFL